MGSIHEGHRARLRGRFTEHGLDSFTDIEALELLLFYALPRQDTNELAHKLLDGFGSFRAVMEADLADLTKIGGIGENAAALIKLVTALNRRYMLSRRQNGAAVNSSKDAGEYLLPLFAYETDEVVYALCLDSKSEVTRCREISRGMVNKVNFSIRDIVDMALRENAARMIIAHNHLSGTALPSAADVSTTQKLRNALSLIGVELADHIIVCDGDFVSLRDSGCFT